MMRLIFAGALSREGRLPACVGVSLLAIRARYKSIASKLAPTAVQVLSPYLQRQSPALLPVHSLRPAALIGASMLAIQGAGISTASKRVSAGSRSQL